MGFHSRPYLTLTVGGFRCGIFITLGFLFTGYPLHCSTKVESSKVAELFNFYFILFQFLNSFKPKVVLIVKDWR